MCLSGGAGRVAVAGWRLKKDVVEKIGYGQAVDRRQFALPNILSRGYNSIESLAGQSWFGSGCDACQKGSLSDWE